MLKSFKLSARAFSEAIGEKPTITQNYVGTRDSMPGADYLEKVLLQFESINPAWLLTGKGEPFIADTPETTGLQQANIKNNSGIGISTGGSPTINNLSLEGCQRELETSQKEVEHLRHQLRLTDALLAAKDETIMLLRVAFNRPN